MNPFTITSAQPAAMGVHYRYWTLNDMLNAQREAGYQSMELYCAMPQVYMTPQGIADRSELLRTIRASGLNVVCVTPDNCMGPWQYAVSGEERIKECKRYFVHALDLAADLYCPLVACHSGWGLHNEPVEDAWNRSLEFMDWYCDQAEHRGITLAMESLRAAESNLVNRLSAMQAYLEQLNRRNLKPMIDTCAMAVAGESLEDWFSAFPSEIIHMHFVDGTPYGHLAWKDGNRPLDKYIESLSRHGYQGFLTQELTDSRYEAAPAHADAQAYQALSQYMNGPI